MKADLLITAEGAQVILTPDTDFDKRTLDALTTLSVIGIARGEIWGRTQGGYYRQFDERPQRLSTVITLKNPTATP